MVFTVGAGMMASLYLAAAFSAISADNHFSCLLLDEEASLRFWERNEVVCLAIGLAGMVGKECSAVCLVNVLFWKKQLG